MRTRDPASITAEVELLLDRHGIEQFFVVDSVFNARAATPSACAQLLDRSGDGSAGPAS